MDAMVTAPAIVQNGHLDTLGANALGRARYTGVFERAVGGRTWPPAARSSATPWSATSPSATRRSTCWPTGRSPSGRRPSGGDRSSARRRQRLPHRHWQRGTVPPGRRTRYASVSCLHTDPVISRW
ncbi:hypothetical protein [Streptomyces sp. NPDC054794]